MNTLDNRKPEGIPMPGAQANAVDALAYLSRVNFSSVVKVLAAIEAIRNADPSVDLSTIVSLPSTPTTSPDWSFGMVEASARSRITDQFVRSVATDPANTHLRVLLNLGRFREKQA